MYMWSKHSSSVFPSATVVFFFSALIPFTSTSSSQFCLVSNGDATVSTTPLAAKGGSEE